MLVMHGLARILLKMKALNPDLDILEIALPVGADGDQDRPSKIPRPQAS